MSALIALWLALASPAPADEVRIGEETDHALTAATPLDADGQRRACHAFEAKAKDGFLLRLKAGFEADVAVYRGGDCTGERVYLDPTHASTSVSIGVGPLWEAGRYSIAVYSGPGATGDYTLALGAWDGSRFQDARRVERPAAVADATPARTSQGQIAFDKPFAGQIASAEQDVCLGFRGKAGRSVTAVVRSDGVEALSGVHAGDGCAPDKELNYTLVLGDETGRAIAELPADGAYSVSVRSYRNRTGGFTLTLKDGMYLMDVNPIRVGQTVSGAVEPRESEGDCWAFTGRAGQDILVELSKGDGFLAVYTDGACLDGPLDSAAGTQLSVTLPAAGTYSVGLKKRSDPGPMAYALKLTVE